jgi:hypothetical protein
MNIPEQKDDANVGNFSRGINLIGSLCGTTEIVHTVVFWGMSLV